MFYILVSLPVSFLIQFLHSVQCFFLFFFILWKSCNYHSLYVKLISLHILENNHDFGMRDKVKWTGYRPHKTIIKNNDSLFL